MRMIETTAIITDEGTLTVQVPPDITPGDHHIVVIIDDQPKSRFRARRCSLPPIPWG